MPRAALAAAVLLLGGAVTSSFAQGAAPIAAKAKPSDPKAMEIAGRVMQSLGGREAWDRTRYLRFGFGMERDGKFQGRRHVWDKWTGRYRVEGLTPQGQPFVTLMNVNSKEGRAWVGGKELAGAELKEALERGYGAWVNDTYWLLMPYKMTDPGVTLQYAGEERGANGAMYDKVNLSFDNVGLTPKDTYWVWVNRDTGMVDRWDYVLKGEKAAPTTWMWSGWKKHGNIMLAGERTNPKESRKLMLPDIAVLETVPDKVFTSPEPMS